MAAWPLLFAGQLCKSGLWQGVRPSVGAWGPASGWFSSSAVGQVKETLPSQNVAAEHAPNSASTGLATTEAHKATMILFRALAEKGPLSRVELWDLVTPSLTKTHAKKVLRMLVLQKKVLVAKIPTPSSSSGSSKRRERPGFHFEINWTQRPSVSHPLLLNLKKTNWKYNASSN